MNRSVKLCAVALGLSVLTVPAIGQQTLEYPRGSFEAWSLDTGQLDNPAGDPRMVFSDSVSIDGAVWLRLYFGEIALPPGSFIRVTSTFDDEYQDLDAAEMTQWGDTTAYFNGDTVTLELWAAPNSTGNRFVLDRVAQEQGNLGEPDVLSACGVCNGDDRSPSSEEWSARLMPIGCTGSVYNTESCMVSAGHCMRGNLVAQFRVPPSTGCRPRNPPIAEQFPITSRRFTNGGVGNDWAVMTTGTNNLGEKAFERYGVLRPIADNLPSSGNTDVWGYGVSNVCERTQAQQNSPGRIMSRAARYYVYTNDVTGGNSGSGYMFNNQIIGVVTHCNQGGCGNIATRADHPDFRAAVADLCPGQTATCDDIRKHKAKCTRNGGVKGKIKMFTTEFDGRTLIVTIDGINDAEAPISGKKAKYNDFFYDPGRHTAVVTTPDCPSTLKNVECQ